MQNKLLKPVKLHPCEAQLYGFGCVIMYIYLLSISELTSRRHKTCKSNKPDWNEGVALFPNHISNPQAVQGFFQELLGNIRNQTLICVTAILPEKQTSTSVLGDRSRKL